MADPITAGIAGVAAISSLASGASASAALRSQGKQADYNARNLELQGKQLSAARRDQLNQSFAAIDAIRSTRNTGSSSPTALAINKGYRKRAYEAEQAEQLGVRIGAVNVRTQGAEAKRAAPFAMLAGIADAGFKAYSLAG